MILTVRVRNARLTGRSLHHRRPPLSRQADARPVAINLEALRKRLTPHVLEKLLNRECDFDSLIDDDFMYDATPKGVDMKIGLDIASVAYKKQADQIILVAAGWDANFVSAAKLARREGIDFVLDPMWTTIASDLHEHIDGPRRGGLWRKSLKMEAKRIEC